MHPLYRTSAATWAALIFLLISATAHAVTVTITPGISTTPAAPATPVFTYVITGQTYSDAYGETASDYVSSCHMNRHDGQTWQMGIYYNNIGNATPYQGSFTESSSFGAGVYTYALYPSGAHPEPYDNFTDAHWEDEHDNPDDDTEVTGRHWVEASREVGFAWVIGDIGNAGVQFIIGNAAPVFVTSPQSRTVALGSSVNFGATATGASGLVQWERLPAGGSSWQNVTFDNDYHYNPAPGGWPSGSSMISFTVTSPGMNGDQYRAVAGNPAGVTYSPAATLTTQGVFFDGGGMIEASYVTPQTGSAGYLQFNLRFTPGTYVTTDGQTADDQLDSYAVYPPGGAKQTFALVWANGGYQAAFGDTRPAGIYAYGVSLHALHPEPFDRWVEAHWQNEYDNPDDDTEITGRHWVETYREIGFDWGRTDVAAKTVPFYLGVPAPAPTVPPTFSRQPTEQTVVLSGSSATAKFSAAVVSEALADLKWQRRSAGGAWTDIADGGDYAISTANNRPTLTITVRSAGMNGDEYRCVASNAAGSATSNSAVLNVYTPPTFVSQPADQGGVVNTTINVGFTATASGQPTPTYQWQRAGSGGTWIDLTNDGLYSGVGTPTLIYNGYFGGSYLLFRCIASNAAGSAISRVAFLQPQVPPSFDQQPQSKTISAPSPSWPVMTYFTASASGTPGPTLQWQRQNPDYTWSNLANGGAYSGVTSAWLYVSGTAATLGEGNMFRCVATNSAGSTASHAVYLYVPVQYPFGFNVQPRDRTAPPGCSVTFTATAVGTAAPTYEWQRLVGGVWQDMGAYGNTLTVTAATNESYRCRAYNGTSRVDSNPAALTVDPTANCDGAGDGGTPGKPIITKQPQDQIVAINGTATFSVEAIGAATYRWYRNGGLLSGITANSFVVIGNFDQWQNGDTYQVEVSNSAGSVLSNIATLYITRSLLMVKDVTTSSFRIYWGTADPGVVSHQVAVSTTGTIEEGDWRPITSNAEWIENGCSAGTTYLVKVRGLSAPGTIVREATMNITTRGGSSLQAKAATSTKDAPPRIAAMTANTLYSLQSDPVPASRWLNVQRWKWYEALPHWRLESDGIPDEVMPISVDLTRVVWTAQVIYGYEEPYDVGWEADPDGNVQNIDPPLVPTGIYNFYPTVVEGRSRFTPIRGYQYQIWYYTSNSDADVPANWKNLTDESDESKIRPDGSYVFNVNLLGIYGVSSPKYALVRYSYAPGGCVFNLPGISGGVTVGKAGGGFITIGGTTVLASGTATTTVNGVTIKANGTAVTASTGNGICVTASASGIQIVVPEGLQAILGDGVDSSGMPAGKIGASVDGGDWGSAPATGLGTQSVGTHTVGITNDTRGIPEVGNTRPLAEVPVQNVFKITLTIVPTQGPKVLLLLHGMNSSAYTWNDFIGAGAPPGSPGYAPIIRNGQLDETATADSHGIYTYLLQFGRYDLTLGRPGIDGLTAATNLNYYPCGDFESLDTLGREVAEALPLLLARHPNAQIVLLGHSRGGLSARAFLQNPGYTQTKAFVIGLLTTGSPHQGSRLGRIYEYLKFVNPRPAPPYSANTDWTVVDWLRSSSTFPPGTVLPKPPLDVRRPVIDQVSDSSSELAVLNSALSLAMLPANIRCGEIVYGAAPMGVVNLDPRYSVFDGLTGVVPPLSALAARYILGNYDSEAEKIALEIEYNGDGLIPMSKQRFTSLPGFIGGSILPKIVTSGTVLHAAETESTSDLSLQLQVLVGWQK